MSNHAAKNACRTGKVLEAGRPVAALETERDENDTHLPPHHSERVALAKVVKQTVGERRGRPPKEDNGEAKNISLPEAESPAKAEETAERYGSLSGWGPSANHHADRRRDPRIARADPGVKQVCI
jgi:hypothetical protein